MIGNPRKADLLNDRAETMELMTLILEKAQYERDPDKRKELVDVVRELGQISKETKELIEKEDREGTPQKWITYYQFMEKFNAICQPK